MKFFQNHNGKITHFFLKKRNFQQFEISKNLGFYIKVPEIIEIFFKCVIFFKILDSLKFEIWNFFFIFWRNFRFLEISDSLSEIFTTYFLWLLNREINIIFLFYEMRSIQACDQKFHYKNIILYILYVINMYYSPSYAACGSCLRHRSTCARAYLPWGHCWERLVHHLPLVPKRKISTRSL